MSKGFMYVVAGFAAIGGLMFGYDVGVISGVLVNDDFKAKFAPLDKFREGLIASFLTLGCFFGALFAGYICDKIGRKMSILISSLVFTTGALMQTFSNGLVLMAIGRIVAGLAVGILSMAVPLYQSEVSDPFVRGRLVSLQQWAITIGIAVSFWVNYACKKFLTGETAWRLPLGLQAVPSIILCTGCFFLPYSHRWLISQGRDEEGLEVLAKLRADGDAKHPAVVEEYNEVRDILEQERVLNQSSYADLFKESIRLRTILGVFIQAFQQLTGINSVMYYAPQIFRQAGFGVEAGLLATAINGIVDMSATIPTIMFVDRWGRRKTLMAGAIIMGISMAVVGIMISTFGAAVRNTAGELEMTMSNTTASYSVIFFIYIFVAGFAFSWGPIAWIYPAEIFPMRVRSKGVSVTTASNWTFNYLVGLLSPILMEKITWGLYIIFAAFCVVMTIAVYFFYPETRGHSLEEIDQMFIHGTNPRKPHLKRLNNDEIIFKA